MSFLESLLRRFFRFRELGWKEIDEEFTRFTLFRLFGYSVYLHKLNAPKMHPHCHDHPWHFWAFIVFGGYFETTPQGTVFRGPGSVLYRTARFKHNVVTKGVSWSIIVTSPKVREWRIITEEGSGCCSA